jgi:hypothetical protein
MEYITWAQIEEALQLVPEAHGLKDSGGSRWSGQPRVREITSWEQLKQWAPRKAKPKK